MDSYCLIGDITLDIIVELVKEPVWADEAHTKISMIVKFAHLDFEVPFTALVDDTEEHGRMLFHQLFTKEFGEILAFIKSPESIKAEKQLLYKQWKLERQNKVDNIKVKVDNFIFDGDEESQNRMTRAVMAADTLKDTIQWTLLDNKVAMVTILQLRLACKLAVQSQTTIWNQDRPL